jgi:divalent metal cation (Fe/Co/Zn/Cd) transporter
VTIAASAAVACYEAAGRLIHPHPVTHRLRAECEIVVDPALTVVDAHLIAVAAEHALRRAVPRLTAALVHVDHLGPADAHARLAAHPAG